MFLTKTTKYNFTSRDGHFRILNPEGSESQTICATNWVIGFDFIKMSIILLQTGIVCHMCINNAAITTAHKAFFICVCMLDEVHTA